MRWNEVFPANPDWPPAPLAPHFGTPVALSLCGTSESCEPRHASSAGLGQNREDRHAGTVRGTPGPVRAEEDWSATLTFEFTRRSAAYFRRSREEALWHLPIQLPHHPRARSNADSQNGFLNDPSWHRVLRNDAPQSTIVLHNEAVDSKEQWNRLPLFLFRSGCFWATSRACPGRDKCEPDRGSGLDAALQLAAPSSGAVARIWPFLPQAEYVDITRTLFTMNVGKVASFHNLRARATSHVTSIAYALPSREFDPSWPRFAPGQRDLSGGAGSPCSWFAVRICLGSNATASARPARLVR